MQLRCACYVCIRGLQLPTMELCACNCCLDHILPSIHTVQVEVEPLDDLVIIYNSYISFLVYTVLDIAQCYIVCRCCYVQHMPIFEERESLGVKTLKSFADIKKRVGDVCHSEIWQVKFIDGLESHFSIKTVTSLWSIMAISMKR